jgi:hypothetical protein
MSPYKSFGPNAEQWRAPAGAVIAVGLALVIAVAVTLVQHVVTLPRPFTYDHAWGATGALIEARAFRNDGILHLRMVPIQNNPPLGSAPDAYVHWPPLLAIILTFWSEVFGESETSTHAFTLVVYILDTVALFWMLAMLLDRFAALFGALVWLCLPVTLKYSHVILNETIALPLIALSIGAFSAAFHPKSRRLFWTCIGVIATVLATLYTWEAVLVPVGLLLGAFLSRDSQQRRLAISYLGAACATVIAVFIWYGLAYPDRTFDTFHTLLYRIGLSKTYSADPLQNLERLPPLSAYTIMKMDASHLIRLAGPLGLLPLAYFLLTVGERWRQRPFPSSFYTILCALLFVPLFWFTIFSKHLAIHEFEILLLVPAMLLAVAWGAVELMRFLYRDDTGIPKLRFWALAVIGPFVLLIPLLQEVERTVTLRHNPEHLLQVLEPNPEIMTPDEWVEFGRAIRSQTVADAVVVTPEIHRVPMYYSLRHTIGGVASDGELSKVLPKIRHDFQGYPLYLALYTRDRNRFPEALASHPELDATRPFTIIKLF